MKRLLSIRIDRQRRRWLVTLALAPALPWLGRRGAGAAEDETLAIEARPSMPGSPDHSAALYYNEAGVVPVLRIKPNVPSQLRLFNRMAEPTALQWHGMILPNAQGGGGLTAVATAAGASRDIVITPRDSGTAWFHPWPLPGLADQTARGLAGVVIVEEDAAPAVDADRVLLLTDSFPPAPRPLGASTTEDLSQSLKINLKSWPEIITLPPGARLRLRIVNGSTRLALAASLEGGRPFVIAIDGQPSELFEPLNDRVPIGPGARFDLLIDLPGEAGAELRLRLEDVGGMRSSSPALLVRSAGAPLPAKPPIVALALNPALPRAIALEASTRASIKVTHDAAASGHGLWRVNGVGARSLPAKPLFSVKRNSAVTLAFSNESRELTAFRLHGHVMRLLHAFDDGWEPYWRDSVIVPAGITHHAAFLADNPGRWLIESPFAEQAAQGLRLWFDVL